MEAPVPRSESLSPSTALSSSSWRLCGRHCPKGEIVFFVQAVILYVVIIVSLYNLSTGQANSTLWTALLSGSLGVISPPPKISSKLHLNKSDARALSS